MNFKEALIAHLQGEKAEGVHKDGCVVPMDTFLNAHHLPLLFNTVDTYYEFRLAPRTITVNGVEVPAPESTFPAVGVEMWFPEYSSDSLVAYANYDGTSVYVDMLGMGLIYLNKDDAIARAKAMLLCK